MDKITTAYRWAKMEYYFFAMFESKLEQLREHSDNKEWFDREIVYTDMKKRYHQGEVNGLGLALIHMDGDSTYKMDDHMRQWETTMIKISKRKIEKAMKK